MPLATFAFLEWAKKYIDSDRIPAESLQCLYPTLRGKVSSMFVSYAVGKCHMNVCILHSTLYVGESQINVCIQHHA